MKSLEDGPTNAALLGYTPGGDSGCLDPYSLSVSHVQCHGVIRALF